MIRKFRKNPISDEISTDDKLEYIEPFTSPILQLVKDNPQEWEEEVSFEEIEQLVNGKFIVGLNEMLDDLEKKITRLAVEYAIQEAQANYGVDISSEMYAQYPTARSNPRRSSRGRGRRYRNRR